MELIALGTGGWIPTPKHETACYLCLTDDILYMFDCGSGAKRLHKPLYSSMFSKYKKIVIVFSHYHMDHIIGLFYIQKILCNKTITLVGPENNHYVGGIQGCIDGFIKHGLMNNTIYDIADDISFVGFTDKSTIDLYGHRLCFEKQKHSNPSYRVIFDSFLVYATDTSEINYNIPQNTFLLHECWDNSLNNPNHTTYHKIQQLSNSRPDLRIGLIHFNPFFDRDRIGNTLETNNLFIVDDENSFHFEG